MHINDLRRKPVKSMLSSNSTPYSISDFNDGSEVIGFDVDSSFGLEVIYTEVDSNFGLEVIYTEVDSNFYFIVFTIHRSFAPLPTKIVRFLNAPPSPARFQLTAEELKSCFALFHI